MHKPLLADPAGEAATGDLLLAAVLAEVRATATEAQERGFMLAVGRRIAEAAPLTGRVTLEALDEGMNRIWHRLGLGTARLALDEDGVTITHDLPAAGTTGRPGEAALLEGAYAGWFAALGNDRLQLKPVRAAAGRVVFHYGR